MSSLAINCSPCQATTAQDALVSTEMRNISRKLKTIKISSGSFATFAKDIIFDLHQRLDKISLLILTQNQPSKANVEALHKIIQAEWEKENDMPENIKKFYGLCCVSSSLTSTPVKELIEKTLPKTEGIAISTAELKSS